MEKGNNIKATKPKEFENVKSDINNSFQEYMDMAQDDGFKDQWIDTYLSDVEAFDIDQKPSNEKNDVDLDKG